MLEIYKRHIFFKFKTEVSKIFGDNLVFAFIFGGLAKNYATENHDIDMFICLKRHDIKQEERFRRFYFQLHEAFNLPPDFNDPGEVTTLKQLDKVIGFLENYKIRRVVRTFMEYEALVWGDIFSGNLVAIVGNEVILNEYKRKCASFPEKWRKEILALVDNNTLQLEGKLKPGEVLEELNITRLFRRTVTYLKRSQPFEEVCDKPDTFHICILGGGGNVAEAVAANLMAKGHRVSQFRFNSPLSVDGIPTRPPRSKERLRIIKYENVSGQNCELMEKKVEWIEQNKFYDVDIFIMAYPSFMAEKLAEQIGCSVAGRPIINLSERFLGSYAFFKKLEELYGKEALPTYAVGFNGVPIMALKATRDAPTSIYYVKPKHSVCCYPFTREYEAYKLLTSIFHFKEEQIVKYPSPLHLAFENAHCIEHAVVDLYNLKQNHYKEGGEEKLYSSLLYNDLVVKRIKRIINERDVVTSQLLNKLFYSLADYDRIVFGGGDNPKLGTSNFRVEHSSLSKAPNLMRTTAFGYEDIGWSIVPMESIAKHFGISTPEISNLIDEWNAFMGCDYRKHGRTIYSLQLIDKHTSNVSPRSIRELLWGEHFFPKEKKEKSVRYGFFTSDKSAVCFNKSAVCFNKNENEQTPKLKSKL